jgi:hypothetical protein
LLAKGSDVFPSEYAGMSPFSTATRSPQPESLQSRPSDYEGIDPLTVPVSLGGTLAALMAKREVRMSDRLIEHLV